MDYNIEEMEFVQYLAIFLQDWTYEAELSLVLVTKSATWGKHEK